MSVQLLVPDEWALQDVCDQTGVSVEDAVRDLALLAVMAALSDTFGSRIVFKGGAALRFAHGASRTSKDADATVLNPAKSPIPPADIAKAIAGARISQFLRFRVPASPKTANGYSLDFDQIGFECADVIGALDVELSYREDSVLDPDRMPVGPPYFAPFEIFTLHPVEMVGEKIRALAQRQRGTDLAYCVLLEVLARDDLSHLPKVRAEKFKLVRQGIGAEYIKQRIDSMRSVYERDVRPVDPSAPPYEEARGAALRLIKKAWP